MEKSAKAFTARLEEKIFSTKALGKAVKALLKDFGLSTGSQRVKEYFYSGSEKKI